MKVSNILQRLYKLQQLACCIKDVIADCLHANPAIIQVVTCPTTTSIPVGWPGGKGMGVVVIVILVTPQGHWPMPAPAGLLLIIGLFLWAQTFSSMSVLKGIMFL